MSTRRTHWLLGLALTTLTAAPASAQAIAYSEALVHRPPASLAAAYHVRLRSAWPQEPASNEGCRNGGDEMVEGVLSLTGDGSYRGNFERRTLLLFCGAHGTDGQACELTLEGDGRVLMTGVVVSDERSPSGSALRVVWRPSPSHGASVRGACPSDFKRSIEAMYLSVTHGAEFAVPGAGQGRRVERLENYAWTVEIE